MTEKTELKNYRSKIFLSMFTFEKITEYKWNFLKHYLILVVAIDEKLILSYWSIIIFQAINLP